LVALVAGGKKYARMGRQCRRPGQNGGDSAPAWLTGVPLPGRFKSGHARILGGEERMDRETVIKGLECCTTNEVRCFCKNELCPYFDDLPMCERRLMTDALSMLKEQDRERKEWIEIEDGNGNTDIIICSVCNTEFHTADNCTEEFYYCPHCGARMTEGR